MGSQRYRAGFVLLCCAVLRGGAPALAASETAGSDPSAPAAPLAAQCVRGAIAAETRADRVDRDRLIEEALRAAPNDAPVRWQAGQVRYGDEWLAVDAAIEKGRQDALHAQYRKLRATYDNSPEGLLILVRWCQKHHLDAETRAHATQLLAVRPNDPEVLKMLDFTWHKGQLITVTELAARKERDEKARQAMQRWRPQVAAIRAKIESKSTGEREQGWHDLQAIRDPDAIEALLAVLKDRPGSLGKAIRVIGQMPGQEATDALLKQAVLAKSDEVILAACQQLKSRSMYGYVPKLMAALSTPVQTRFAVAHDSEGVHFQQTIGREAEKSIVATTLDTEISLLVPNPHLGEIIGEAYTETLLEYRTAARENVKLNRKLKSYNDSIYRVLDNTVGSVAPHQPGPWWDWWHEYNVTRDDKKPAYVDNRYTNVDVAYVPPPMIPVALASDYHAGCFARGTKVWTLEGSMPIEEVQVGDRVLSQGPISGELTFKPVIDVTIGSQDLMAFQAGDEEIVATKGHVFWVSGSGWRMTKQLKAGDRLHTVSGWSEVTSIKPVEAGETHNLVVADFNTYFVGDGRMLVHDVTTPDTVTGGVPGELASATH